MPTLSSPFQYQLHQWDVGLKATKGRRVLPGSKIPLRKTPSPPGSEISTALCCSPDRMLGSPIRNSQLDLISLTCSQLSLLLLCKATGACCKFSAAWKLLRAFYFIPYFSQALVFKGTSITSNQTDSLPETHLSPMPLTHILAFVHH